MFNKSKSFSAIQHFRSWTKETKKNNTDTKNNPFMSFSVSLKTGEENSSYVVPQVGNAAKVVQAFMGLSGAD